MIKAATRGDPEAKEALVERHWDGVYAFSFRLTTNVSDAEDLTQETFLRAFERLKKYQPAGVLRAWLLRIATNLFFDIRKSARARDVTSADAATTVVATDVSPHEAVSRQEMVAAVWEGIRTLAKEQQVAFVLRVVEHLEYHQIAEILAVKESTARWHMYEARRLLRLRLGKRFEMEGIK